MKKLEFIELCNLHYIDSGIALENEIVRKTLKEIIDKKINPINGQIMINTILQSEF